MITEKTNVIGHFKGTVDDLLRPFVLINSEHIDRARRLAFIYLKYDRKFAIRADISFAQMCHETGYLTFTGTVKPDWNNFAGIGITGPTAVQKFKTETLGVLAHVVHLCWYYYPNHVNSLCNLKYDPRHFGTVYRPHPKYTGDTTLEFLNGKWAVPGKTYAQSIAKIARIINNEENEIVIQPKPKIDILLKRGDRGDEVKKLQQYLSSIGYYLVADGIFGPKTEAKVKAYQRDNGLKETGYITPELKEKMNDFKVKQDFFDIIVQMGHVGIYKGMTGTPGEREWTKKLGDAMQPLLAKTGLKYRIMGGLDWLPKVPNMCKIFFSLHADGSTNPNARGFSCGFKPGTNQRFKDTLAVSYKEFSGFPRNSDNYTSGLRLYYMWTTKDDYPRSRYKVQRVKANYYCLLEHGFFTNPIERAWLENNVPEIAKHHVKVINNFLKNV